MWLWLIRRLDWLDDEVIGHRCYWLCVFISKYDPGEKEGNYES